MPVYATNRKAAFDYEILDTIEAGLILTGNEVKSSRGGGIRLAGGFVTFRNNDAFLTNVHIPKYKFSGPMPDYRPERSRQLLLKRQEISRLKGKSQEKGLTIIPLSLYTKGRYIKLAIGVARGKKQYDKRRSIKKRELDRETRRVIKNL